MEDVEEEVILHLKLKAILLLILLRMESPEKKES